jgi:cell division protein FtsB
MPYRNLEPMSKQLTIVVGLTVVGFMAFGLALSYYRNILFEETLKNIKKQNSALLQSIAQGYRDLEYYRSTQYKDKYAKESLGFVNPGGKVLINKQPTPHVTFFGDEQEINATQQQREAVYLELLRQMPVRDHWKLFLLERQKLEQLRSGL